MRNLAEKLAMRWARQAVLAAAFAVTSGAGAAWGAGVATTTSTLPGGKVSNAQLQKEIRALKAQVSALQARSDRKWMSQQEARQVRQIAREVLANAKAHSHYLSSQLQAGYDNGFFIRTPNKAFQLLINGYLQFRYTYAHDQAGNNQNVSSTTGLPTGAAINPIDVNGFDARRARLILTGNAFTHIIYSISGDFAGGPDGSFQILDTWAGYKFSNALMIRAGSMLVPFTHVEYYSSGTEFPEFAAAEAPFDPVRSLALDFSGNVDHNKLFYDFQINNGSQSQGVVHAQYLDNRMGFYGRVQFAGAGTNNDFTDSPDVSWHKHLVWAIGAAAGYEEQNSTPGSLPAPQTTLSIPGIAVPSGAGFLSPNYVVNGGLYRATIDGHMKYRGLALNGAVYYQQINATPGGAAPTTTANLNTIFGTNSFWQLGYYAEAGYFLVPHRWEIAGRFGQLSTDGAGKSQFEYTLGLNYYIFGENAKIQTALTYLPNAAYSSPNIGSEANTQDIIGQVQLQVKF
ncbi:MAG: OprO/OprP family phosphate-selective porin [Planctomycetes bacterium]|jgi:hypothetical protein|nr:OprO/OprP family phosphate-selective porin [Planctomycetota bacterium]